MTIPGTTCSLTLGDGRALGYWDGGDPDGRPVLLQPGTPSSRLQAAHAHDSALSTRVRLVSLDRPGYGGSDPAPPGLAATGLDALALADALELATFASLGVSGGGPFALATAVVAPDRVTAVGVLGGVGCWPEINPPTEADAAERHWLALARVGDLAGATAGMHADAERAFDDMLALDDEAMLGEFLLGTPEEEAELFTPDALAIWAADLRAALTSYDGYVRDNLSWGCPWDIDVREVHVPTHLWYGELDTLVPPSHGRWIAERIRGADLLVLAGQGHGRATMGHWNEVLRTLRRT